MNLTLEWARYYLSIGISVIPIHNVKEGDPRAKKPVISWKKYQNEYPADDDLVNWFEKHDYNIAIVTGKISNLSIVDLDSNEAIQFAVKCGFAETPTSVTRKGYHLFYKFEEHTTNFQKRADLPGIDLRSEGGYVLACPSIHPSGHIYSWEEGSGLGDLPRAKLPIEIVAKKVEDKTPLKDLYKGVKKGERNQSIARMAGSLVRDGLSLDECMKIVSAANIEYDPSLPEEELKRTVESIYNKEHSKDEDSNGESQLEQIYNLIKDQPLFSDRYKDPYIFIDNIVIPLTENKIKKWLKSKYFEKYGMKFLKADFISQVVDMLISKAEGDETPTYKLVVRCGEIDGVYYYDLCNGKAVEMKPGSWKVVPAPILFRSFNHQNEQPDPVSGHDPWKIFDHINIPENQQPLLMAYIVSCFVPNIVHPILCFHGSEGTAKTTTASIIKQLVDSSELDTLIKPNNYRDVVISLLQHHVCFFDNISKLTSEISDLFCMVSTGAGISVRKLYSDMDTSIRKIQHCVGLTGINQMGFKPDFLSRSLIVELPQITKDKRIAPKDVLKNFNEDLPQILGGIFDTIVMAMQIYPGIKLDEMPRMAEFTKWGVAINYILGISPEDFLKIDQLNQKEQRKEVIENSTFLQEIIELVSDRETYQDTIKNTWRLLCEANYVKDKSLPGGSNHFKRYLTRIKKTLEEEGITYTIGRRSNKGIMIKFTNTKFKKKK